MSCVNLKNNRYKIIHTYNANVYRVMDELSTCVYILKICPDYETKRYKHQFKTEINVLSNLNSIHVPSLITCFEEDFAQCFVETYIPGMNAKQYFQKHRCVFKKYQLLFDVLKVLQDLHQIGYLYIDLKLENLIKEGGLYIPTAGIVYRGEIKKDYPECCIKCHVGDHPLQIMCGLKGKVRYFSKKMVAYRYGIGNSWTATRKKQNLNKLIASWKTEIDMLEGLNEYSNHKYERFFYEGEIKIILSNIGNNLENSRFLLDEMLKSAPKCIEYASFKEKIKIFMIKTRLTFIWKIVKKIKTK